VVKDLRYIGKLGSGFASVDELAEVDIGCGEQKRPTYLNTSLTQGQKAEMGELLKGFIDCFSWDHQNVRTEPGSCGASFTYQMRILAL
jgi:hypothetical protein